MREERELKEWKGKGMGRNIDKGCDGQINGCG